MTTETMVPFVDLKAQYQAYKDEIDSEIQTVIDDTAFIMGPQIARLEAELAAYVECNHALTCSSGTDALLIALMALDVQPGDEIITTPFTFFATGETIVLLGCKPVFVDIEPDTLNMRADLIAAAITSKTKAIMPVSLYGQPSDMEEINNVAARYGITVIEDGAQSFGATYRGAKSGNLSAIGCTSFFPAKPLGCYGDGGAIFTSDDKLAEKMAMIRNHGQAKRYHHDVIGINGRMDTLQAAVLLAKFKYYPDEVTSRQAIANRYSEQLRGIPGVQLPVVRTDRTSVYAQYTLRVPRREELQEYLKMNGVPTSVHYPIPLPQQAALRQFDYPAFPETERAAKDVISLPICAFTSPETVAKVSRLIRTFYNA